MFCKTNLRGRIVLTKGDKPYTTKEIESKLQKLWKVGGAWRMLSLGRGFYEFFFSNETDMRTVWSAGTMNLKPGLLRLFEWSKDFNMHTQRNTHAQVWVRLLELPQEYWMERTLREIARAVGTPLLIDNATTKRLFGHYARILVDMDLSRKLFHEIVVEREGFSFTLEVAYERLPDFCTHCHSIGHDVSACRRLYPRKEMPAAKDQIAQGKKLVPTSKPIWAPIKDNPSGIDSSAVFEGNSSGVATEEIPKQPLEVSVPVQLINNPAFEIGTTTVSTVADTAVVDLTTTATFIEEIETDSMEQAIDTSQQETMDTCTPLQTTLAAAAGAAPLGAAAVLGDTPTPTPVVTDPISNFISNVSEATVRNDVDAHAHILSPVREGTLDVSSIVAPEGAPIHPIVQNDLNFMQQWLSKASENEEVPFTQVVSKAQKKKQINLQQAPPKTRSRGPLPPFK